jgi:drug/metabolite transporter (DMT)-like permease
VTRLAIGKPSREAGGIAALVAITACWGSTFVVVKDAVGQMPALDFLFWRFGIATLCILAVRPRILHGLGAAGWRRGILLGAALGAGYVCQTIGLEHTPATVSGFITGLFVVFTPLCAGILLRQRVTAPALAGVALATVGLGLIALRGWQLSGGEALTLGCALAFALQIVGLGEWAPHHEAGALAVLQLGTTAILCLIGAAPRSLAPPPTAAVWGAIALTAVAATAIAFFVQTWAQSFLDPTRAAIVLTLEPVFAAVFGVLVGGDRFDVRTGLGAACVLAAMLLVELGPRHAADAQWERLEI